MKTGELLRQAATQLRQAGCEMPRLDAELLLMHVWRVSRTDLIVRSDDQAPKAVESAFNMLLQRRTNREPLAYITGKREFWSRSFLVTPDVLIPRPETEHLIEAILERFPNTNDRYCFCDIGSGSGCIAITLACEYPNASIVATDISGAALEIARKNAAIHAVSDRIAFRQGDMLQALQRIDGPFDAIISNPPYIAQDEMPGLQAELSFEPHIALSDGQDGLRFLKAILDGGMKFLKLDGYMILETGLCGLPPLPLTLRCEASIYDLAGHLRGAIYKRGKSIAHG